MFARTTHRIATRKVKRSPASRSASDDKPGPFTPDGLSRDNQYILHYCIFKQQINKHLSSHNLTIPLDFHDYPAILMQPDCIKNHDQDYPPDGPLPTKQTG
ncbi:hypothetical protein ACMYR3_05305 [Ampullimonas aquatilis]|uniref:hypothetical protein n=1 Tax=Ampullimonas aquatilis TaxID=1341549 RepID=UPI003C783CC9